MAKDSPFICQKEICCALPSRAYFPLRKDLFICEGNDVDVLEYSCDLPKCADRGDLKTEMIDGSCPGRNMTVGASRIVKH